MASDSIDTILDRLTERLGGFQRLSSVRVLRMTGDITEDELEGTYEAIYGTDPLCSRVSIDLGPMRYSYGFDGNRLWSVNSQGRLRTWADPDRVAERRMRALFGADHYLLDRNSYDFSIDQSNGVDRLTVISREHRDKPFGTLRVEIDRQTGLVLCKRQVINGEPSVVHFEDYEEFDGLLLPRVARSEDAAGNIEVSRITSLEINPEVESEDCAPPEVPITDLQFLTGERRTTVDLDVPVDHIFTEVVIAGHGFSFMVDTGASSTVVDETVVRRLGLRTYGRLHAQGVSGSQEVTYVDLPELWVGDVLMTNETVITTDFHEMRRRLPQLDGILGRDFLGQFVIGLDYMRREMTVVDRAEFRYEGGGERIALDGVLCHMSFDGLSGKFRIDTGAPGLNIHAPFVRSHKLVAPGAKLPYASAIGGLGSVELKLYAALTHEVTIGSYTLRDLPVRLTDMDVGPFANASIMGNAGAEIWRRFITWFDLGGGVMYLEPNTNFHAPPHTGRYGCALRQDGGKHYVDSVLTRSPAEAAGVQRGDEVLDYDGVPVTLMTLDELRLRFREPAGTRAVMRVRRDGDRILDLPVVLEDFLPYYDTVECEPAGESHTQDVRADGTGG